MPQYKIVLATFPYKRSEDPDVRRFSVQFHLSARNDPRFSKVEDWSFDDTPIPMLRNRAMVMARQQGFDYMLMVDSDMSPDLNYPGAKPFWPNAFDFAVKHEKPCLVAAPYCGPPPIENVYVFLWRKNQSEHPGTEIHLQQFTREEAAIRSGFEEVAALPTGIMLIDLRILDRLEPPYFYYEYTDEYETQKAGTEDVSFTRDVSLLGYPVYCFWDSWAGHWKPKCVGKPDLMTVDEIRQQYREAILKDRRADEKLTFIHPSKKPTPLVPEVK